MRSLHPCLMALMLLFCLLLGGARAEPPAPLPAVEVALQVRAVLGPGQRRALAPGALLRSGDSFDLTLSAARAAHVYVAQVAAKGAPTLLSSADGQSEVLVSPGQEVVFPGGDRSFHLDDQIGTDNLLVLAAERALTPAEQTRYLQLAADKEPAPPPPPPIDIKDRPLPFKGSLVVRTQAAPGRVALLRFPIRHAPRRP